jgi:hypothetical protein
MRRATIIAEPLAIEEALKGSSAREALDDGTEPTPPLAAGPTVQPDIDQVGGEAAQADRLKRLRPSLKPPGVSSFAAILVRVRARAGEAHEARKIRVDAA